jgi:predicted enzyme related to lactoylglutathione lyase
VKVENIQATLDKATQAGGKVIVPETEIPGGGTFALRNNAQFSSIVYSLH